ncbi:hypothetical protein TNIN_268281 [Trichonephila inaurata madagascariensis]|uniref:Uncharacterized protein n=1 Tax=Trichonephila inaurata madagascariensis TaxID=2747483 RepID=A0A8X6XG30_9ARAC|nr:hypothetical protein TNIN_268281 [Trichonephila inaurata madagascariensis]
MNRDDSDLSSLSNDDDHQGDIGSEIDDDDEDQDTQYSKYTHTRLTEEVISHSFAREDGNDESPPKRRVTTCIPHQAAHNNEARNMPEMVGDRNHQSSAGRRCARP